MEKYIIMKKVNKFKLLAAGLLIGVAFWLLGSDFFTFMIWWEIFMDSWIGIYADNGSDIQRF